MKQNCGRFVKQGDLLLYCDNGKFPNYKDNSRAIEILRKDKLPNQWVEIRVKNELWFKYVPMGKCIRKTNFKDNLIRDKTSCEICFNTNRLERDHWIPRKDYGSNTLENLASSNIRFQNHISTRFSTKIEIINSINNKIFK